MHQPPAPPGYDPDSPIRIKGLVTDPIRSGFQLLQNYESTYWRALVGNDAWSLYEVLRSFCHTSSGEQEQKDAVCWPSINLLAAILGFKERRVLTGYTKTVKGKLYAYEGLIEILQKHELVIAREVGAGSEMRYEFDVILTLNQLSPTQVEKLPFILQTKHKELLERCEQNVEKIKAGRRPSRISAINGANGTQKSGEKGAGGGSVIYRGGSVNYRGGFGNLPTEQQQENNTQLTEATVTIEDINNNRGENGDLPNPKADVVVALVSRGISEKVALRLSGRYSRKRLNEKISYRDWLVENDAGRVKNPAGWLRRAIEENYAAPDGFVSKDAMAQRARRELEQEAQERRQSKLIAQERQEQDQRTQAKAVERMAQIREKYNTAAVEIALDAEIKKAFQFKNFNPMILAAMHLLKLENDTATIGLENQVIMAQAKHPGIAAQIKRELRSLTKKAFEIEFILMEE